MNLDKVTIEDCIQMVLCKNKYTIINDGRVTGWIVEEVEEVENI